MLLDGPSWSGDGSSIAFTGIGGKVEGTSAFALEGTQLYVVGADGTGLRPVPGTTEGHGPVFSPDGRTIAFTRARERRRKTHDGGEKVLYRSWSVWLVGVDGNGSTRLTPWRNGLRMSASSFSPDGSTLAVSRAKREARRPGTHRHAARRRRLDGHRSPARPTASTPRTAPSSPSCVSAAKGRADLFTMDADGSDPRRLTRTATGLELWPSWDPSGRRLVVTRVNGKTEGGVLFGLGNAVVEMNADGSCPTTILRDGDIGFYGATWQPGPGREAGPIAC